MRFSLLYDLRNPRQWRRDPRELYQATLDQIAGLEELGFDGVWLAEHHFVDDAWLPAIFPLAGAIAARTTRLTIGSFVLLLPLHNPVFVAEQAAALDVLSGGRFVLGAGLGYREPEFRGYGISRAQRGARMEEGLRVVRRCWAEWGVPGVRVWVGARGGPALDRAARLADGWLAAGAGAAEFQTYQAACARHGRRPGYVCALKNVWVGNWAEVGPHATYVQRQARSWYGEAADLPSDAAEGAHAARYPLPLDWHIVGDPSFVADQIAAYQAEVPIDELVMLTHFPGISFDASHKALQRFAKEVMPRFQ
jgi:alkanesulfonate monooxygenase SsuD/methylene tetrahydromethanopterin reductase-like flavin-dependent oxidoreductase (luciferase family)